MKRETRQTRDGGRRKERTPVAGRIQNATKRCNPEDAQVVEGDGVSHGDMESTQPTPPRGARVQRVQGEEIDDGLRRRAIVDLEVSMQGGTLIDGQCEGTPRRRTLECSPAASGSACTPPSLVPTTQCARPCVRIWREDYKLIILT